MNKIKKVIEESNREFDEKFFWLNFLSVTHYYEEDREKAQLLEKKVKKGQEDIKSFISKRDQKILSAIEEEVEGEIKVIDSFSGEGFVTEGMKGFGKIVVKDIQNLLKQAKEK